MRQRKIAEGEQNGCKESNMKMYTNTSKNQEAIRKKEARHQRWLSIQGDLRIISDPSGETPWPKEKKSK